MRLARRRLLIAEVGLEIGGVGGERRLKGTERLRLPRLQRRDALEAGEEARGNRIVAMDVHRPADAAFTPQLGRASCRERVCQSVYLSVSGVSLQTTTQHQTHRHNTTL